MSIKQLPWTCPDCGRRDLFCPERKSHSPFAVVDLFDDVRRIRAAVESIVLTNRR